MNEIIEKLNTALIDLYHIEREIGSGGMATVFLARDLKHERPVALKLLRPELAAIIGSERFLNEIRVTANLQHPHILPLFDSGRINEFLYYVMPYIEGESLADKLDREKQLPIDEAIEITKSVASALDYAHRQNIIHRDIKPGNILLQEGTALVTDFGIALAVSAAAGDRLTETGLSPGTPEFMSPEQGAGDRQLDARSDIYSLGCVLYQMLTGQPPHTGPTVQAILASLLTEKPKDARELRETTPSSINRAIKKALARIPADRYVSASHFIEALDRDVDSEAEGASITLLSKLKIAIPTAILTALVVGGLSSVIKQPIKTVVEIREPITFTGQITRVEIAPDGEMVAYVSNNNQLMVKDLKGGQSIPIGPVCAEISTPKWSPNGSAILFSARVGIHDDFGLFTIPRLGGSPLNVAGPNLAYDYHPSGDISFAQVDQQSKCVKINTININSGQSTDSFLFDPVVNTVANINWSPDGQWLAIQGIFNSTSGIAIASRDGSIAEIWNDRSRVDIRWSPAADAIYYFRMGKGLEDNLLKIRINQRNGKKIGDPVVVMSNIPTGLFGYFDLSSDGQDLAYVTGTTRYDLWTITSDSSVGSHLITRQLSDDTAYRNTPRVSPDGEMIAFTEGDAIGDNIYLVPYVGGLAEPVLLNSSLCSGAQWSPSGHQILFHEIDVLSDSKLNIAEIGEGFPRPIGQHLPGYSTQSALFLDEDRILYQQSDRWRFSQLDLNGEILSELSLSDSLIWESNPVASPNGEQIAIEATPAGSWGKGLFTVNLRNNVITHLYTPPLGQDIQVIHWADDESIYFALWEGIEDKITSIWRIPPSGCEPQEYLTLPFNCYRGTISMSNDAARLVCIVQEKTLDIWIAKDFDPVLRK